MPHALRGTAALLLLVLLAGTSIASFTSARAQSDARTFEQLDEYIEGQVDDSNIPAVSIAIVEGDQIVHTQGFGENDGEAITPDTPFPVGSLTKSFTALSIMQLAEAGRIDLDAPVQDYIPWFEVADADASARITVRHLLNQTSGLSRLTGIRPLLEQEDETLEQSVRDLRDAELITGPGETYEYSNANYVTLGLLVEVVSGQSYADYVEQHIFEPLDMQNSFALDGVTEDTGPVDVHRYWFGVPVESEMPYLRGLLPTGYLASSAGDMAHYLAMYLNGGTYQGKRILSAEGIATMLEPATNEFTRQLLGTEFTARYGMGWFAGKFGEADANWHLGQLPYLNAWMVILPETNQAAVVLINANSQMELAGANHVMSRIPVGVANLLVGEEPPEGISIARFYAVFNLIVLLVIAAQVWALFRLLRRPLPLDRASGFWRVNRYAAPLVWEFGLSLLVLFGYPALTGIGWRGNFVSIPDLTIVLLAIAGLWLVSGLARVYKLLSARGLIAGHRLGDPTPGQAVSEARP